MTFFARVQCAGCGKVYGSEAELKDHLKKSVRCQEEYGGKATDRARMHRALDAVLDGKKARDAEPRTEDFPHKANCPANSGDRCRCGASEAYRTALQGRAKDDHISSVCTHCGGSGKVWNAGRHVMCGVCGGSGRSKNSYVVHGSANWPTAKDVADSVFQLRDGQPAKGEAPRGRVRGVWTVYSAQGFGGALLPEKNFLDESSANAWADRLARSQQANEYHRARKTSFADLRRKFVVKPRGAQDSVPIDCGGDAYTLAV